jgi:hypothetical protein
VSKFNASTAKMAYLQGLAWKYARLQGARQDRQGAGQQ